ncbi:MAG: prepilin-type N-terminal cleavage/methylation domain-containing protein [Elusimicrobia bacterium]|nr:prepilin-type N-terminal cleavage/methylation domain-containing protein [Elusimicrobiota bacterium]
MKNKKRGVTLVELMVVVALMAIIFIPLVQIFKSFTNAWWAGKARMTVQAEARDSMYWFTKDMKSAYRHGVGNLVRNGGFDSPDNISSVPTSWEKTAAGGLPAGIVKISSPSTRGFCIGVFANATYSSTFIFNLKKDVRYILTGKIADTQDGANWSRGEIRVENEAGTSIFASTSTPVVLSAHTTNWEILTANDGGDGTFTVSSDVDCVIRLTNLGSAGTTAYFENISVTPKMAVLVGTADTGLGEWKVATDIGYPFISEMQTETGYTKYLARYKIEVTTDSANKLRNRIWRQKAKTDMASFANTSDWESIDYNHIAEYCDELKIGYDVSDALLAQNGTDTGISMELVFRRSAGGSVMQPYSMKTYIYPQSP